MLRNELVLYVKKIMGDHPEVEDIVQETLLTSIEKQQQLKNDKLYKQWVFKIAKNKSIDWLKKNKSYINSDDLTESLMVESETVIPIQTLALRHQETYKDLIKMYLEEKKSISEIIDYFSRLFPEATSLSEKYLQVFLLVDVDNLSQVEVAQLLNLPLPTIKSRYQRAKKKIMQLFFAYCDFEFDSRGNVIAYAPKKGKC